jgi:phage-related protein
MEEVQTSAGEIFLPLLTDLANVANDSLVPALRDVVQQSGPELAAGLAEAVPALVDLLEAVIPLLPELVKMGSDALPVIIGTGQVLIPILSWLTENTSGWLTAIDGLFSLLGCDTSVLKLTQDVQNAGGVLGWLTSTVFSASTGFIGFATMAVSSATSAVNAFRQRVGEAVSFVQSLPQRAIDAIGNVGNVLTSSGRALIGGFIEGIQSMLRPVGNAVGGIMDFVRGFFPNSPADRGPFSGSGWTNLAKSGGAVFEQFTSGFARPDLTGRLTPALATVAPATRVTPAATEAMQETGKGLPISLRLVVGEREFTAYVQEEAGTVVGSTLRKVGTRR